MGASIRMSFILALTLVAIHSVSAEPCHSGKVGQCLSREAVHPGTLNERNVFDGIALLQVGQDLGHHHGHKHTGIEHIEKKPSQKKAHAHHTEHHSTARGHKVQTGLLSIMSEPRDDASTNGVFEQGATFKVSSEYDAPDGRVWLHLSDGRGWVHRDAVAEIQQAPSTKAATPKGAAPRSQDQIREEYKKLPMKETGLAEQLEHNHGRTINADWRNEYPYKKDPKPLHKSMFGATTHHSLSIAVVLSMVAVLAA